MSQSAVYLLVPEGLADWEPAYAVAMLRRWGWIPVRTVGFTAEPVTTMGGLRVLPDLTLADLPADASVQLFLLPGGDLWEGAYPEAVLGAALGRLNSAGVPIAGICGATIALARAGLLRGRRHTSNGADYLGRFAPGATDAADYVDAPAVRDRGVITACGLSPVEFAYEIFGELGAFGDDDREAFLEMYRHGRIPASS
jgi:putative intracellular protease/amidase